MTRWKLVRAGSVDPWEHGKPEVGDFIEGIEDYRVAYVDGDYLNLYHATPKCAGSIKPSCTMDGMVVAVDGWERDGYTLVPIAEVEP